MLEIVGTKGVVPRRAAAFPAAKGVVLGPRAGRRALAAVRVGDARLDVVVKVLHFALVVGIDTCGESKLHIVGESQSFFDRLDFLHGDKRYKELVAKEAIFG